MASASELIDALGGTAVVSRLFGIQPPSVHEWRKRGISTDRLIELIKKTGRDIGSVDDLAPENWWRIWPELARQLDDTTHINPGVKHP